MIVFFVIFTKLYLLFTKAIFLKECMIFYYSSFFLCLQFIGLIAGLVYLNQGSSGQDSIRNLNGVLFFVTTTMTFNSMTGSLFVSFMPNVNGVLTLSMYMITSENDRK